MKRPLLFLIAILALFGVCRAFAGGADESIDPRNGCYAKASTHTDGADQMADFVNHRGKYSIMVDDARFGTLTNCWENRAKCIRIPTVCRKDGNIVYEGFIWMWRGKK